MATSDYEIRVFDGKRELGKPNNHRFIAVIHKPEWRGSRNCGCSMHKDVLRSYASISEDKLVNELADRLYDDYVTHYGDKK